MKDFVASSLWRALFASIIVCLSGTAPASAQTLPSPWLAEVVGRPTLTASATFDAGVFRLDAAGTDITGTADHFYFLYQAVAGDLDLVVRIDDLVAVSPWTIAGVMIRSSLESESAHGFVAVTAGKGVAFRSRTSSGAVTAQIAGPKYKPSTWLRLVRTGSIVKAYTAQDAARWIPVGSATIAIGSTAYVGVAVTSRERTIRTTARASNLSVSSIGLPAGREHLDIGAPAVAGEVSVAAGVHTIRSGGAGITGPADQFHFIYQPVTGNTEVVARVAAIDSPIAQASTGVMIRESLAPESRYAAVTLAKNEETGFQARFDPATESVLTPGGSLSAPGWLRLRRTADLFEAFRSTDGVTWTQIGGEHISMAETVYVGLAASSQDPAAASTSLVDNFSITATPGVNQLPAVSIVSPAASAEFTAPATITISALATDPEDRLASVDFYADLTPIATMTAGPFTAVWSPSAAGTYMLTAVAHDQDGGTTTSSAVAVTIAPRSNTPPSVSVSASGLTSTVPASVSLKATATDPDGQIVRVEFFDGATPIGTATAAPYVLAWSGISSGPHLITAIAYDNEGAAKTSGVLLVSVRNAPVSIPKYMVFTASPDHGSLNRYVFKVFAAAANPATATPVASSDLGKPVPSATGEITVDRLSFFTGLAPGSYQAVVTAVGSAGQTASTPVVFIR